MREILAKWLTALIGMLVVLAALGFAALQNYVRSGGDDGALIVSDAGPLEEIDPAAVAAGIIVYEEQACGLCHSVAGRGDTRYPLDGVGARLSAEEIRKFVAPPAELRRAFPGEVFSIKQQYHDLPDAEMVALVHYLRSLR